VIVGLHHVALVVTDLDAAIGFYTEHLGCKLVDQFEWQGDNPVVDSAIGLPGSAARGAMMQISNAFVELWQYQTPPSRDRRADPNDRGYSHIALQVQGIAEEHARLTAAGMTFVGPPVDFGNSSAIYGRDPFGNLIELYELRDESRPQLRGLPNT